MTMKGVNIYKEARQRAHMTIETAAEMLNVAPRSLQHYEAGDRAIPDEIVAGMMQTYNAPYLGYQHLRASPVGRVILPEVAEVSPAGCAIRTALVAKKLPKIAKKLMIIGEDNRIDKTEADCLADIQGRLKTMIGAFFSVVILSGEKENAVRRATERRSGER